jgi:hypothetical protein
LNDEASLAQAQSNYEWLVAQIQAMQAAQNAGVCGDSCESALSTLESEIPEAQSQIQTLTQTVNEAPPANFAQTYATPSQIAAQVIGFTPSPALVNTQSQMQYGNSVPTLQDLASETPAPSIVVQAPQTPPDFMPVEPSYSVPQTPSTPGQSVPSTGLEQFVSNAWNTIQGWLQPPATSSSATAGSCSLFASLFGGCK